MSDPVLLYTDGNYGGYVYSRVSSTGNFGGDFSDKFSSCKVPPWTEVILWKDANQSGSQLKLTNNTRDVALYPYLSTFNDVATSMTVNRLTNQDTVSMQAIQAGFRATMSNIAFTSAQCMVNMPASSGSAYTWGLGRRTSASNSAYAVSSGWFPSNASGIQRVMPAALFSGLSPNTLIIVDLLVFFGSNKETIVSTFTFTTMDPSILRLTVSSGGSSTMLITWDVPSTVPVNAVQLYLNETLKGAVNGSGSSVLSGLTPGTVYEATLRS